MNASVRAARARLSKLLDRAAAGEEIVITSAGRPKAKLVGLAAGAPAPQYRKTCEAHRRGVQGTVSPAGRTAAAARKCARRLAWR